ncbi:hypothetical protein [Rossellomorea aquimaris]|uniref:hypothetical protein n=1 Tax=Rossellomorea aquimaris TaxID=189382 RepID=UPI0007D05D73|nr:hypothetical protein [Rossellomorea aquimaris]
MTTFLLFLSFLLNIISLLGIVILFTRQNRVSDIEKKQEKIMKEMEEVISTYLLEMKEENESFLQNLENRPSSQGSDMRPYEISNEGPIRDKKGYPENNNSIKNSSFNRIHAAKAYKNPITPLGDDDGSEDRGVNGKEPELEEKDLSHQVLTMKNKGLSIEEIAKRVGKGKTEIELLIKFRQKM